MDTYEKCAVLAREILSCFQDGLTIDDHTKRYILACFPDISLPDLANRLCDTPDLDIAPLMDLIFFPGEAFQIRLEPLLEKESYSAQDEERLVSLLRAGNLRTTLRTTENRCSVPICVPETILDAFVRRLGISRRLPSPIVDTIKNVFSPKEALRIKVMLRNTRFAFSSPVTDFLDTFFRTTGPDVEHFQDCFDLLLALLEEEAETENPFLLLKLKLASYREAKQQALQFERRLQHSNMEILMHQGVRAPETSPAEADKKILLIERIMGAVITNGTLSE